MTTTTRSLLLNPLLGRLLLRRKALSTDQQVIPQFLRRNRHFIRAIDSVRSRYLHNHHSSHRGTAGLPVMTNQFANKRDKCPSMAG